MPRNHSVATSPGQVLSIINGAGITDTSLWYYSPRQNLTETRTYTYTDVGIVPIDDIAQIATTNNFSSYETFDGTSGNCKYMIGQNTTINITESYTYDVFYWTP